MPFPPEYAQGYNVLAFTAAHATRISALAGMRPGGGTALLPMKPPPVPNAVA
jgi:hypothetical protein